MKQGESVNFLEQQLHMPATEKDLGVLLNSKPTSSQQCVLVRSKVKISVQH